MPEENRETDEAKRGKDEGMRLKRKDIKRLRSGLHSLVIDFVHSAMKVPDRVDNRMKDKSGEVIYLRMANVVSGLIDKLSMRNWTRGECKDSIEDFGVRVWYDLDETAEFGIGLTND